jgi:hypothetical protein
LADIFTKPPDSSRFAFLRGGGGGGLVFSLPLVCFSREALAFLLVSLILVFAIPMAWFEGEIMICLVYLYPFTFLLHFLHTHLSYFASPVILACICLILFITMLE